MIILASTSPRRKEILDKTNIKYKIVTKEVDEVFPEEGTPSSKIIAVALDKGRAVLEMCPDDIVVSADTGVVLNEEILGKPKDFNHALEMLLKLNNTTHKVITGVAILTKTQTISFYEESTIKFKNNSIEELFDYVQTEEPVGKAGAYAIQGIGEKLVDSYSGDLDNIIGFPLSKFLEQLKLVK